MPLHHNNLSEINLFGDKTKERTKGGALGCNTLKN